MLDLNTHQQGPFERWFPVVYGVPVAIYAALCVGSINFVAFYHALSWVGPWAAVVGGIAAIAASTLAFIYFAQDGWRHIIKLRNLGRLMDRSMNDPRQAWADVKEHLANKWQNFHLTPANIFLIGISVVGTLLFAGSGFAGIYESINILAPAVFLTEHPLFLPLASAAGFWALGNLFVTMDLDSLALFMKDVRKFARRLIHGDTVTETDIRSQQHELANAARQHSSASITLDRLVRTYQKQQGADDDDVSFLLGDATNPRTASQKASYDFGELMSMSSMTTGPQSRAGGRKVTTLADLPDVPKGEHDPLSFVYAGVGSGRSSTPVGI